MSRIDTHVSRVRNKLTLAEFIHCLAQATLVAAVVVLAYVVLRQFTLLKLPREAWFLAGLGGVGVLYALVMAFRRRPNVIRTAVAIDDRLGLKEKFSTALHARNATDPFSQAAIADAEQVAVTVNLHQKFPIKFPVAFGQAVVVGLVGTSLLLFVEPRNLFASDTPKTPAKKPDDNKKIDQAHENIKKAIAAIDVAPKSVSDKESIQLAKAELRELAKSPNVDPNAANRKALNALQDLKEAIKEQISKNQKFDEARNQERLFEKMEPGDDAKGPVADAQRAISKGDLSSAIEKIDDVVQKFDKLDEEQQKKAADQMQQMAKQLQQLADDPKQQKQMEEKLQQMGMNQQQAQQAMQAMQQAAQGNPQAQQQLQQMAQQAMQQMNNGQGATQQQQQQIQQMMQKLQGQANTQAQAQQLQQAAQAMAQAMQQASQGNQSAQQQANQGNQSGQQNPQANQGQNSQNNGQQPGGQTPQQQMAQAAQQMQQQMQQMQAIAQDAQQIQAAQQAAQAAQQAAQGGLANNPGQDGGQGQNGQGQGQQPGDGDAGGDPNGQGPGGGGPGQGQGAQMGVAEAPYTVKQEVSKSKDIDKGKVIAATFVKADALKGESKAQVREVAQSAIKDSTDEVDSERVGRQAQTVVKNYFGALGSEDKK